MPLYTRRPGARSVTVTPVLLHVYDLSNGKAAMWSELFLGTKIKGIWHTGLVAFGLEYFYGFGIERMAPMTVRASFDMEIVDEFLLGYTTKTKADFDRFITSVQHQFAPDTYDLIEWNCNHFTDVCSQYLLHGRGIPEYILALPELVGSSFMGDLVLKFARRFGKANNPIQTQGEQRVASVTNRTGASTRRSGKPRCSPTKNSTLDVLPRHKRKQEKPPRIPSGQQPRHILRQRQSPSLIHGVNDLPKLQAHPYTCGFQIIRQPPIGRSLGSTQLGLQRHSLDQCYSTNGQRASVPRVIKRSSSSVAPPVVLSPLQLNHSTQRPISQTDPKLLLRSTSAQLYVGNIKPRSIPLLSTKFTPYLQLKQLTAKPCATSRPIQGNRSPPTRVSRPLMVNSRV